MNTIFVIGVSVFVFIIGILLGVFACALFSTARKLTAEIDNVRALVREGGRHGRDTRREAL